MKIIFSNYDDINNPYYAGGGAVAVHEIAKRFAKDNKVIVITGKYPKSTNCLIEGVEYRRIGSNVFGPKIGQLLFSFYLPFVLKKLSFDIWIESFTPPFSTAFLPLFTDKPVVGLVHMLASEDMERKYKLPFHLVERLGLRFYKNFIILNRDTEVKIRAVNKHADFLMVPNGINIPVGISKKRPDHILFIGRIEINQKGLDLLLSAYKIINSEHSLKLVIAGGGTTKEVINLTALIKEHDLGEKVNYVGRVDGKDKDELFSRACFVVIPSRYETFSIVSLEAAMWGLPIVCFDIKGLRWLTRNCAAKIACFNVKKLAEKMHAVMTDRHLRKKLGESARSHVRFYTWDNIFKKYQKFVNQLV